MRRGTKRCSKTQLFFLFFSFAVIFERLTVLYAENTNPFENELDVIV